MKLEFKSADETINFGLDICSQTAVTDLTRIEKELGKDLTDIIQKVLDVSFNVTSPTFTRGPKDAYVVSYSWELHPVYDYDEGRVKNNTVKAISVTVGDSEHNMYEFEDVEDCDVDAMITWLRNEHKVYYTPNNELLNEKQKKIDSYEATLGKITDIMKPEYAGPAWSETWDDLVERIKRMKEKSEELKAESTDWMNSFTKAQDARSTFCKKLKEALNVDYRYPGSFPKMEEDILAEIKRLKTEENSALRSNLNYFADIAQGRQMTLSNVRYKILKVYREIFDCSDGDPEGTDAEALQDILTEYKRTLELKNVADEKTIDWKERARENEEKATAYKDIAKENRVQWNNTKAQLQWAQKENLEWVKRYEKLKSELNEMKRGYGESVITSGGLCEDLAKEREKVKRMEQKLIEIQDICER